MEVKTYKMLRKKDSGVLFPYTDQLAERDDMELVELTDKQLQTGQKPTQYGSEVTVKSGKGKPGPGWVKNRKGFWVRRKK